MTSTSEAIKELSAAARPLVEQQCDLVEQFTALRKAATEKGIDWGQLKGLLRAQILDARDESGSGKHVERIIEKADFAASYVDLLGLTPNMNKRNAVSLAGATLGPRTGKAAGEAETQPTASSADTDAASSLPVLDAEQGAGVEQPVVPPAPASLDDLEMPEFLRRKRGAA